MENYHQTFYEYANVSSTQLDLIQVHHKNICVMRASHWSIGNKLKRNIFSGISIIVRFTAMNV